MKDRQESKLDVGFFAKYFLIGALLGMFLGPSAFVFTFVTGNVWGGIIIQSASMLPAVYFCELIGWQWKQIDPAAAFLLPVCVNTFLGGLMGIIIGCLVVRLKRKQL